MSHRTGTGLIYASVATVWLFWVLAPGIDFAREAYLGLGFPHFKVVNPSAWSQAAAFVLAILATGFAAWLIKWQRDTRVAEMRDLAASAVYCARKLDLSQAATNSELILLCAMLSNERCDTIRARAKFFERSDFESYGLYSSNGSPDEVASGLVTLLTDLPPGWLFDCATNRRGIRPLQDEV